MNRGKQSFTPVMPASGFSLLEMAVVLMIMGILMSGVLVSVSQTTLNARRSTALAQLRQIQEALYGYAQTQGRLPCPAIANGTGKEDPVGTGVCTVIHGFVPAATLGFDGPTNQDGLLLDPWQNPYRYSVASVTPSIYTTTAGIDTSFATVSTSNAMRICSATTCSGTEILTDIAPAVVLTMGEDWITTTSAAELHNANNTAPLVGSVSGNSYFVNNDYDFISANYTEDQFDDQLVWLSPYVLFNRMVSAEKLP